MLRHNFFAALRQLWRNRVATALNVIGLVIGLGCFVFADGTASFLSGRGAAPEYKNIFLATEHDVGAGATEPANPQTTVLLAPALRTELPAGYRVARLLLPFAGESPVRAGNKKLFMRVFYADPELLGMFPLPAASPDALRAPRSVVLTDQAAAKLFGGDRSAIGRTVTIDGLDTTVTAVTGAPTAASPYASMVGSVEVLASWDVIETLRPALMIASNPNNWFNFFASTYVSVPGAAAGTALAGLNARLAGFGDRHMPKSDSHAVFGAINGYAQARGFANMAVRSDVTGLEASTILDLLGSVIVVISVANYINLSTAQVLARAREVRIRRILGATSADLLRQHMLETGMVVAIAALLLALCFALLLVAGNAMGATLRLVLADQIFWLHGAAALIVTVLAAGLYPAILFASLKAAGVPNRGSHSWLRAILTAMQFAMAATLLIFVLTVRNQNGTLRSIGFSAGADPVVAIESDPGANAASFRAQLRAIPEVRSVSSAVYAPWGAGTSWDAVRRDRPGAPVITTVLNAVGEDYFGTMGVKLVAGRELSGERGGDGPPPDNGAIATHDINVVIDRNLAQHLGWQNPADAVGQALYIADTGPLRVVGVAVNRPTNLIVPGAQGGLYWLSPNLSKVTLVRIDRARIPAALAKIDAAWDNAAPLAPEKREFIDDLFGQSYRYFANFTFAVSTLVALAFLVALAGLAGMAIEVARSHLREIAIRKMLGATTVEAARLLLWQFAKPLLAANLIAWPLAFAISKGYLSLFVTRAPVTLSPFIEGLAGTILIAGLIVANETVRAARVSPAGVLGAE